VDSISFRRTVAAPVPDLTLIECMDAKELYRKTFEVFLLVGDLEEPERSRVLDLACGDDAVLRQEVESLLRHHRPNVEGPRDPPASG
jgi:hypothetical protein